MMNQHELITKLNGLKTNFQHLISKLKTHPTDEDISDDENIDGIDNFVDDLPLTLTRDPSPDIKFYTSENSEISRGANKTKPRGIDSFGEENTFDFDEADD